MFRSLTPILPFIIPIILVLLTGTLFAVTTLTLTWEQPSLAFIYLSRREETYHENH